MAHKTLIDGTAYNVVGGSTMVDGTAANIVKGRTLVEGTGYDVPFSSSIPYTIDDWPGWSNATWQDINNLCVAKQRGYIDEWPDGTVAGGYLPSSIYSHYIKLAGVETDGDGTLTFARRAYPNEGVVPYVTWTSGSWIDILPSRAESHVLAIEQFANQIDPHVLSWNFGNDAPIKYFPPSIYEMDNTYDKFSVISDRVLTANNNYAWVRNTTHLAAGWNSAFNLSTSTTRSGAWLPIVFVVGNPNSATIG